MSCSYNSEHSPFPYLSSTAYAAATYLNSQLSADDLATLGTFLKTLGYLLELNSKEKIIQKKKHIHHAATYNAGQISAAV